MEKKQAQKQIRDIFQNSFNVDSFRYFIRNLLNDYEVKGNKYYKNARLWDKFWPHINFYERIGKYVDPNGDALDILVVEVPHFAKLERARSTLRSLVVKHLTTFGQKDYALAAFYAAEDNGADWRFSFIKIEHTSELVDGKVKIRTDCTPAKRYSYLVGEHENSHTAQNQLLDLLAMDYANPAIEQIEAAFSIEKVTNEFFEQYKALFENLSRQLQGQPLFQKENEDESRRAVARFAKKLLGQIVFLYFLQKKGWLGVKQEDNWGAGDKRFMGSLFNEAQDKGASFYDDFLQYLFYEALAEERKNQPDPAYYKRFNCKIPFLNGGLFEAEYDWRKQKINLPDSLFRNQDRNKAGDTGTGILDVFDRYNFTIKEDEPLEKEVAVDPEMLGKVFENMLEITERKSKGAFYTPREIVHYMCQESLIHYLDNSLNSYTTIYQELGTPQTSLFGNDCRKGQLKLTEEHQNIKVPKTDIKLFIRKGHLALENDQRVISKGKETDTYRFQLPESVRKHARLIDEKLATIKICDPAIGSGAFPVGLLHEIVNARLVLAPHSSLSPNVYTLKRHTIQESLYGVDIDPSAIDVARLRLWLSLIVDEDDYDNIEALPNLDYKIVRGNSLVGFPENWQSPSFRKIEELKEQFFNEKDQEARARKKKQIDAEILARMENSQKVFGYQVDFDFRLYFSEVWHEKNGFDMVIGNPPYVQIQKFSGKQEQKDWEKQKYKTFTKTGDIYCLFYEKGGKLLKNRGILTFITSNKWMRANYGKKMRKYFLEDVAIEHLIDFGDSPIFSEATTYTNIILFSKNGPHIEPQAWDLTRAYSKHVSLEAMLSANSRGEAVFSENSFIILPQEQAKIKKRIEEAGTPLKEWDIFIYRGVLTGFNEAFIIDGKKRHELIAQDHKNAEIIKPILRGRNIKRYKADFADLWLIDTHNGYKNIPAIDVKIYPVIKAHFEAVEEKRVQGHFGEKAKKAKGLFQRDDQGKTPYNLRNCAYHQEFENEKLIWLEMSPRPNFTYSNNTMFVLNTAYILTGTSLKYLLAVLNSSALSCYFPLISTDVRGKTRRYIKQYVENLLVPRIANEQQRPFEFLVDYLLILKQKAQKLQSAYFEQLIDAMVFELYFPEELKAAGKEILKHMGELKPITHDMTDEEKKAIIQSEFNRLYDPGHPVRNNLETLDSVEEVRIIKEAVA